jgi:hypothetical protein
MIASPVTPAAKQEIRASTRDEKVDPAVVVVVAEGAVVRVVDGRQAG